MTKNFRSIIHVRWELPFPILLPSHAFFCWEPKEEVAVFVPEGHVGSLQWNRMCSLCLPEVVFGEKPLAQDPNMFSKHDYKLASVNSKSKKRVFTAELLHGPNGGFIEAKPYTVANIFLCTSSPDSINDKSITLRANAVLNNIIDIYRLLSLDPLLRPINEDTDHYYTIISEATLPKHLHNLSAREILTHIEEMTFGGEMGKGRVNKIGIDSFEDLKGNKLSSENIEFFNKAIQFEHQLELFHQLIFSAIRRLKRKEGALAIIDAQSSFESAVASMLKDGLHSKGWNDEDIKSAFEFKGRFHLLIHRLIQLEEIANEFNKINFFKSDAEREWRLYLYDIRNEIVHGGKREVSFDEAKRGIVSGLKAIRFLNDMCPLFERKNMWSMKTLELPHIQKTSGRLSRIFEA